jgi:hypothetical protein
LYDDRFKKFCLWVKCLCNRVLDQEACGFLKSKYNVDVQPDSRSVNFDIPEELAGNRLLKKARETAAELNFRATRGKGGEAKLAPECQSDIVKSSWKKRHRPRAAPGGILMKSSGWRNLRISTRIV